MTTQTASFGLAEFGIAEFGLSEDDFQSSTITIDTYIVYENGLERYKQGFDILRNQFAFQKHIVYRRYINGNDNQIGDKDYRDYIDYTITAEFQFEGETKDISEQGYINTAFGNLFLPAIVQTDYLDNTIASFRPQVKDEFKFDGKWYEIHNMTVNQFANNSIGMECLFRLISTGDNPR